MYERAYAYSVPPIEGERHWPASNLNLDPPPIKIGPGRPRKNRIKDPYEHPKKPGHLTRHGMEMTCFICSVKGHNKRRCPSRGTNSNTTTSTPATPKRGRGRPRKEPSTTHSTNTTTAATELQCLAQPSRVVGRGGRIVVSSGTRGRGRSTTVRGGGRGSGGRGGSGRSRGRSSIPLGHGVYVTPDGTAFTNTPGSSSGPNFRT